jgi:hypothetical protein
MAGRKVHPISRNRVPGPRRLRLKRMVMRRHKSISVSEIVILKRHPPLGKVRSQHRLRPLLRQRQPIERAHHRAQHYPPSAPVDCSALSASFGNSSANLSQVALLRASWAASARRGHLSTDRRQAAGWLSGIASASRLARLLLRQSWQRGDVWPTWRPNASTGDGPLSSKSALGVRWP